MHDARRIRTPDGKPSRNGERTKRQSGERVERTTKNGGEGERAVSKKKRGDSFVDAPFKWWKKRCERPEEENAGSRRVADVADEADPAAKATRRRGRKAKEQNGVPRACALFSIFLRNIQCDAIHRALEAAARRKERLAAARFASSSSAPARSPSDVADVAKDEGSDGDERDRVGAENERTPPDEAVVVIKVVL